ncbi:hypothetical protein HaLaN_14451 [Haematococcus lacustris]|uniref:Uncharacterized protein n=1 Tax=Haematococcus lacustris TaxID=44745 RepID=A0A699Z873_HAELA|nr:hypothetical protein HaLaN_14451 [Haematococcus lacustris]
MKHCKQVWGGGGLSATSPQPLSDPTAAADAHAHVEQPKRRGRWSRPRHRHWQQAHTPEG